MSSRDAMRNRVAWLVACFTVAIWSAISSVLADGIWAKVGAWSAVGAVTLGIGAELARWWLRVLNRRMDRRIAEQYADHAAKLRADWSAFLGGYDQGTEHAARTMAAQKLADRLAYEKSLPAFRREVRALTGEEPMHGWER